MPSGSARAFMNLQRDGAHIMAGLSCLALVTLLPIYARGANYYSCVEPLMHTSLAYLADAPALSSAAAIFAVAFAWASAVSCRVLWSAHTACESAARPVTSHRGTTAARTVVSALIWLSVTVLPSAPTALYVTMLYLPANNTLHISAAMRRR